MSLAQVRARIRALGILESIFEHDKTITLSRIVVPQEQRGTGIGTIAMTYLTDYADQTGQRIVLTPAKDFGASSVARLRTFYKRFGFFENKGRHKDYTTSEMMIRVAR